MWNTGANTTAGMSCSNWIGTLPGIRLATSFEIPYATAREKVVDTESARAFGRDLAHALAAYLRDP
jgi:hypothetical protein